MPTQDPEIKIALKICLSICIFIAVLFLISAGTLIIRLIFYPDEVYANNPLVGFFALSLISLIFFIPLFFSKKKIALYFYIFVGGFICIIFTSIAFSSLFQVGRPSMEFIFLGIIACFGLWMFLAGINPAIRKSFSNQKSNENKL